MSQQQEQEQAQQVNGETPIPQDVAQVNGEENVEEQPEAATLPPLTIRFPSPSCSRTVPKPKESSEPRNRLTIYPQPNETVQDIKLLINDWVGAYWLGPYSLRLPFIKGDDGRGKVFTKKDDLSEIRAGEKLNEWLEIQDAFAHLEEDGKRVLEVVKEPYGEFTARQSVLRLLELIAPSGTTANITSTPIALQAGSTIFESVRDGILSSQAGGETQYEEVEVSLPSGRKGKGGKKELVKVKRAISNDKSHAFSNWTSSSDSNDDAIRLGDLPFSQSPVDILPCLKSIQISPFNPPPPHLRQLGHQLYLQVALLEGETSTIICTTRGWYVSKSNVNNFDPSPKSDSNGSSTPITHSLIDLLHSISPLFSERLSKLSPISTEPPSLDPISTVAIPQAEPSYPWLATTPKPATSAEILKTQLAFLHTGAYGADSVDAARDWNEEIQGIRELPRGSMQERVFREKMLQKIWAEFDQASIRAVQTVSRGDIPAINPSEDPKAHMYLQSNIFITQGDSDALDAYAHLGGDAAMRISHGKDAAGVKLLNKLDVDGLYMLGHTIVDWQGKRWICQSILPGIFSNRRKEDEEDEEPAPAASGEDSEGQQKEDWVKVSGSPSTSTTGEGEAVEGDKSGETEVDAEAETENPMMIYGLDSEKQTSVHWDKATHKLMSKIGQSQKLAAHKIKDGKGEEFEFYASAEVKGLKGTDGRRYLLDAQRLSSVDIEWLERDYSSENGAKYPHRLVMLRPELLETFWESELKRWARGVADKAQAKKDEESSKEAGPSSTSSTEQKADGEESKTSETSSGEEKKEVDTPKEEQSPAAEAAAAHRAEEEKPLDASVVGDIKQFELNFNPDAFIDQIPSKDSTSEESFLPSTINDESDPSIKAVRDASVFLRSIAIPAVVLDVLTGNTSGIMDGASLTKHLHGRGINMRYLGHLASTIKQFSAGPDGQEKKETGHLAALKAITIQEMIFRASKHILRSLIANLQPETVTYAISHFLNCLLGTSYNSSPSATFNPIGVSDREEQPEYTKLTPDSLRSSIISEIQTRFRFTIEKNQFEQQLKKKQLLRELATRFGFQLSQRDYIFDKDQESTSTGEEDKEGKQSKDKKSKKSKAPVQKRTHTFEPEDVLTLVPIVKSTAPSVTVAEEILEAGRNTINRGSIDLGLEFMLEGLQLYENIHSVIHPEVASVYNQYSQAIHQLARLKIQQVASQEGSDPEQPLGLDISTALRLQRQAITISERTQGIYHHETAGYYFNLAMLENLEGNSTQALRYFRHVLNLWNVIHGPGHPEINTVLSNAGVVLQAINETSLALTLQKQAYESTLSLFGESHIQTGQSLHQLTQSHFLAGDMASALSTSEKALDIFNARLGEDHTQTKEVKKNVELLRAVIDNVEKQKERNEQMKKESQDRLKAARERIQLGSNSASGSGSGSLANAGKGRRLGSTLGSQSAANGVRIVDPATLAAAAAAAGHPIDVNGQIPAAAAAAAAGAEGASSATGGEGSNIGTRGTESVEELVRFIQGQQAPGGSAVRRGKNALRGKRRTGAKR